MKGYRKYSLGLIYLVLSFTCLILGIVMKADAGVLAAISAGCVSVSSGLLVVVRGVVDENRVEAAKAAPAL